MKIFQIQRLLQKNGIILNHVNYAMEYYYIFVKTFKQNKRHENAENKLIFYINDMLESGSITH